MTTSGTYVFNPTAAELFAAALGMIGVRRTQIEIQHITDAALHANMALVDISNRNPNQWLLEIVSVTLTPGVSAYALPSRTIAIGSAYVSTTIGGTVNDRILASLSATEYSAIPIKTQQGFPNSYWFNLAIPTPNIYVYYTPDAAYTYTLNLVTFRQTQDLNPTGVQNLDSPYRFLDAFLTGLASRLAVVYPDPKRPSLANDLAALYERRMGLATSQDQENVNIYVIPGLSGYFR